MEASAAFKQLEAMKSDRSNYDPLWQDLFDYFQPNKNLITRESTPGENKYLRLYDSTGAHSCELFSGALHTMLTNPASYFFEYTTGMPELDAQDDMRKWLQAVAHILHEVLNGSNFQTEIHELYMDMNTIGIAAMSIEEDKETIVRFSSKPMRGIYVKQNARGIIDTVFHCFKWTPQMVIDEFPDSAPAWIKELNERTPEAKVDLLQIIVPNRKYDASKKLSNDGKKFKSCTYLKGMEANKHTELSEAGFDTYPWVTPRWTKATGEDYGRSPSMKCLPEVKMINEMMKETIRAQQKATNPPLLIPDDGLLGSLKSYPGGLNFYRAGNGDFIKPLESGGDLQLSFEMMEGVREHIRNCFYIDQLKLKDGPQMTATESMIRNDDNMRLLSPLMGRQHSELLKPLLDRVFEIADKRKLIPPAPAILKQFGGKIAVKYRSTMAKAQFQSDAQNLQRGVQAAAPFLQISPEAVDVLNAEEGVRYVAQMFGFPTKLVRNRDEIAAIREGRAQAQQEVAQQQQEMMDAEKVAKVAPAVKMAAEAGAPQKAR